MAKQKNPRRVVLVNLREVKRLSAEMVRTWDQSMIKYDPIPRAVMPEEKHENNPDRWTQLIQFMDAIILKAGQIRGFAVDRRDDVRKGERW